MGRLLMFLFLAWLVLTMVALISCLSADEEQLRGLPRPVWVTAIIFVPFLGAISYFSSGRPQPDDGVHAPPSAGQRLWRTATTALNRPTTRPVAPDDDPDFLATIDGGNSAADDEMLRRWEEEFRNRGDDQRKQDKKIDDSPSDG
jgi:hypothetical protein